MAYVAQLRDTTAGPEEIGTKGATLAMLARSGHPVPPGFVVTAQMAHDYAVQRGIYVGIRTHDGVDHAINTLFRATIPYSMEMELGTVFSQLGGNAIAQLSLYATNRPEVTFEELTHTVTGLHSTADLMDALRECWAYAWSAESLKFRLRNRIRPTTFRIAVVVQAAPAQALTGQVATADPRTHRRDVCVIGSIAQPGGDPMSDRRIIVGDDSTVRFDDGKQAHGADAGALEPLPLNEHQSRELAALAAQVEQTLDHPVRLDWAYAGGRFWVLDAAPLGVPSTADAQAAKGLDLRFVAILGGVSVGLFGILAALLLRKPDPEKKQRAVAAKEAKALETALNIGRVRLAKFGADRATALARKPIEQQAIASLTASATAQAEITSAGVRDALESTIAQAKSSAAAGRARLAAAAEQTLDEAGKSTRRERKELARAAKQARRNAKADAVEARKDAVQQARADKIQAERDERQRELTALVVSGQENASAAESRLRRSLGNLDRALADERAELWAKRAKRRVSAAGDRARVRLNALAE
ncbi:PEP/pyruvate-binding domain-containing protein [Granulicoccus phenolivorans]|uniref:PEP/pyruvate-binding domain-containing protein n=1 Tax=Granulicoccus phenolivorans TaxID=266854 RepID=UPI00047C7B85|nr:PEP/pyruvate-binding domain-containing protein [Granulicoccus phenolivorans]